MSWSDGYSYCLLQRGNGYNEDSEDSQSRFDRLELAELALDKRKFLLNRLFVKQPIPQDED